MPHHFKFAEGDYVETCKGAHFWGIVLQRYYDEEFNGNGYVVRAVHPDFLGTKHVYPEKQLQLSKKRVYP